MTPHERKLWYLLRDRRLSAIKFRRQFPVGPYIADFAAVACKLDIELDGSQHAESKSDPRRDAYMRGEGWRILRFWNNELIENREGVLTKILEALATR